jgi:hypothetical protein
MVLEVWSDVVHAAVDHHPAVVLGVVLNDRGKRVED